MNILVAQTPNTGTVAGVEVQANALDNTLNAGSGNDTVVGLDSDDLISGDAGDDVLYGNNGVDSVAGGDQILLGKGDYVSGSFGLEIESQMLGDDVIRGGAGLDEIVDHLGEITCFGIKVLMYLMRQTVSLLRIQPHPLLILALPIR